MTDARTVVIEDGTIRFIYGDDLAGLLSEGEAEVTRASHVEPYDGSGGFATQDGVRWTADMRPVDGPVLGPFPTRQAALDAEVAWLQEHRGL